MTNKQLLRILRRYPRSALVLSNHAAPTIKLSQDQSGNWTVHIDPIDLELKRMVASIDPEVGWKSIAAIIESKSNLSTDDDMQEINNDAVNGKSNLEN